MAKYGGFGPRPPPLLAMTEDGRCPIDGLPPPQLTIAEKAAAAVFDDRRLVLRELADRRHAALPPPQLFLTEDGRYPPIPTPPLTIGPPIDLYSDM